MQHTKTPVTHSTSAGALQACTLDRPESLPVVQPTPHRNSQQDVLAQVNWLVVVVFQIILCPIEMNGK